MEVSLNQLKQITHSNLEELNLSAITIYDCSLHRLSYFPRLENYRNSYILYSSLLWPWPVIYLTFIKILTMRKLKSMLMNF